MKLSSYVLIVAMSVLGSFYAGDAASQRFTKTASPSSGNAPLTVTYTYTWDNTNKGIPPPAYWIRLDTPSDKKCSPLVFQGGDTNSNGIIDVGEIWTWTCTTVINTTTENIAVTGGFTSYVDSDTGEDVDKWLDFIWAKAKVTIIGPPSVSISGGDSACVKDLVTLTADATGGTPPYTFAWSNGATSQAIVPDTSTAGTYSYRVTVTDKARLTASADKQLSVALICSASLLPPDLPHVELPLLTTIEWRCDWSFAGQCLEKSIAKICIGGNCYDNPGLTPKTPLCVGRGCGVQTGLVGGALLGLVAGVLLMMLLRRRGSSTTDRPSV